MHRPRKRRSSHVEADFAGLGGSLPRDAVSRLGSANSSRRQVDAKTLGTDHENSLPGIGDFSGITCFADLMSRVSD